MINSCLKCNLKFKNIIYYYPNEYNEVLCVFTLGGRFGYSGGILRSRKNNPFAYGVFGGPIIVAAQSYILSPTGPAENPISFGSLCESSLSSFSNLKKI